MVFQVWLLLLVMSFITCYRAGLEAPVLNKEDQQIELSRQKHNSGTAQEAKQHGQQTRERLVQLKEIGGKTNIYFLYVNVYYVSLYKEYYSF